MEIVKKLCVAVLKTAYSGGYALFYNKKDYESSLYPGL